MKELFLRSFAAIFRCCRLSPFLPLVTVFRRLSSLLAVCHQLLHIFEHLQPFLPFVAICLHWSPFAAICHYLLPILNWMDRFCPTREVYPWRVLELKRGLLIWVGPVLSEISRSTRPLQFSIETFLDISVKVEYSSIIKLPVSKKELLKTSKRDRAQFHWLKGHVTKAPHVWLDK